jgi:chaperonin cofactor prefoldin
MSDLDLITEQLKHQNTILQNRIDALTDRLTHSEELTNLRLQTLEKQGNDHETRLRVVGDGVVQFKLYSGLVSGGSSIVAIVSFVKAFFGG